LSSNKIKFIPNALVKLTNLKFLYFQKNKINFINLYLYTWIFKNNFDLSNNPGSDYNFGNLPDSIL